MTIELSNVPRVIPQSFIKYFEFIIYNKLMIIVSNL